MKNEYRMEGKNMKTEKKIIIILLLSISILFSLFTVKNYAANETTNTSSSKTTTKSSNANLSDLGITPYDFKGFKYGTTYYEVTVPNDTESVEVYAKTQDSKAKLTGTGKKKLVEGENRAEVVVTAEDGTKKTYTINIIRESSEGNTTKGDNNNVEETEGLEELKIADLALTPEFRTDIYEYSTKYIGEETKLDIKTKPTNEDYIVEVTGNENLQEGENIITILVSEQNGDNVATYQITINKSLVDYEAIAREEAEKKQKMIIGTIGLVIIIAIIVIIIKHKRNRKLEEEFLEDFSCEDDAEDEYEDEYEDEIPRALREKRSRRVEDEEKRIREMPKEELKEEFLKNYSNNELDNYKEYKTNKNRKNKGKRFK